MLSDSQMVHGKVFENIIKGANGIFSFAAADRKRSPGEKFDISARDDNSLGIPTSIKTSGGNTIALSDARSFWESFDSSPYRMIIGLYKQIESKKVFSEIHELIIRGKYRGSLLGAVTLEQVTQFHNKLKGYPAGTHHQAREWAKKHNATLKVDMGLVTLNPKIGSKDQRRLQCSIELTRVIELLDEEDYKLHRERFGTVPLPLKIISGRRRRSKPNDQV